MQTRLLYIFILSALVIFITSCTKSSGKERDMDRLVGSWEWVRTDGGLAFHIHETPVSTGNIIELKLTADKKYYVITNGVLSSQGSYSLEQRTCIHDHKEKMYINFSAPSDVDMMVEKVDQENLELSDEAFDGVGSLYQKKDISGH